jgi:hypothetical protein
VADELFRQRTPEAAARQLAVVLASATEMHLATLEELQERKSTPKHALRRQESICKTLTEQCAVLGIAPGIRGLRGTPCIRLSERLAGVRVLGLLPGGVR